MREPTMSAIPNVLVTGASRGLGRGIAIEVAKMGCSIAINYAGNAKAADETVELCKAVAPNKAQKFITVQADIAKKEDRDRMVDTAISQLGKLDALVNNAGIAPKVRADITEASEESFEELIRTNLQGPYFLTQRVVNHWLKDKPQADLKHGFKVIFVSSLSATVASINRGDYCISKAGLAMATQLWASRLAADGIQVIELRPGIMATDMTSGVKGKYDALLEQGIVPQKRWGTPEDVGLAVTGILSGFFPFSTGDVINVDGGFHLKRL